MSGTLRLISQGALAALLVACAPTDDDVFTLYRSSPVDPNMRIHISSFDASDGDKYNRENCEVAQGLFLKQPGVTVRYWCEKGRYRK